MLSVKMSEGRPQPHITHAKLCRDIVLPVQMFLDITFKLCNWREYKPSYKGVVLKPHELARHF